MIKAIIFDCFGVLSTEGFRVFCDKYFEDQPEKRAAAQELMDHSNLGLSEYRTFVEKLAELGQVPEKIVSNYLDDNVPNEPLFSYIREKLKPQYKVSILSNASANWIDELFSPEDVKLFDDILLSFQVQITKPDPAIYELAAKRLGVEPAQCVLVDDIFRYCDGARAVGMQAILYEDFDQMKTDLEQLLSNQNT